MRPGSTLNKISTMKTNGRKIVARRPVKVTAISAQWDGFAVAKDSAAGM
jgi:hypothetical protein